MTDSKPTPTKRQIDKFREAARELGTDESEERFNEALKKVAKAPAPKSDTKESKKSSK